MFIHGGVFIVMLVFGGSKLSHNCWCFGSPVVEPSWYGKSYPMNLQGLAYHHVYTLEVQVDYFLEGSWIEKNNMIWS